MIFICRACDLCGRILENFNFSTEVTFVKNAAGQVRVRTQLTIFDSLAMFCTGLYEKVGNFLCVF